MTDDQLVEALATQLWGMNLDRDAHSIARDLVPVVREVAPLVARSRPPLQLVGRVPRCTPSTLSGCRGDDLHVDACRHA